MFYSRFQTRNYGWRLAGSVSLDAHSEQNRAWKQK